MKIDLSKVPPEHRAKAEELLKTASAQIAANPLLIFYPHSAEQERALAARTPTVACFAGNQSGKTTVEVVRGAIELLPRELLPDHLLPYKRFDGPVHAWMLCPSEDKVYDSLLPAIDKWLPSAGFKGGNRAKAFNGERMQLSFANGSTLTFKTYKQEPQTLGGATLHFVLYDEPPPRAHRDEAATRLLAHEDGFEFYAMTPLKANTGWIRRDIWRKREADHITVCKWSMHDNPTLSKAKVKLTLESYRNDVWRRAREFGDFMDVAGLVYADILRTVVKPSDVPKQLDHVWGIDPGIRNAAVICGGFDSHGTDWIYNEQLIQNGTPTQYAQAIDVLAARHGLKRKDIQFVIDPAARARSQVNAQTVQGELERVGIYTMWGANDKEAGQQQIRDRILHGRIKITNNCIGLLDDADEFAWEMDEDEETIGPADDAPFHRLATLRYQVMVRPFYPEAEIKREKQALGRKLNEAPDLRNWRPTPDAPPMGSQS